MIPTVIRLLPDKSGRVRIHWFIRDAASPLKTAEGFVKSNRGPLRVGGTHGRIACQPKRETMAPTRSGSAIEPCCHSDDVRAVTCPQCMETQEFKEGLEFLQSLVPTPAV